MAKRKPKVGEKLFLVDSGNRARRHGRGKQRDCVVNKVGRKYFYVKRNANDWYEIQFTLENWIEYTDCCADYALYESRQEWEDACLADKYHRAIYKAFDIYSRREMTLSQLKQIAEILGITLEDKI